MTWLSDPETRFPPTSVRSGYSLLEILVVLTILALIAAMAPVAYRRITPALQTREAATETAAYLRTAQARALQEGYDVTVLIDVEKRRVWSQGEDTIATWPDRVNVIASIAASQQQSQALGAIVFYSDGGSTGGRLRFMSGEREYYVDVDWLLGTIQMSRQDHAHGN